ncbi:MAG TPA: hypothetical protein VHG91_11870, partial [Longimicrobium sp.]|nr:hypothetical protein [Longimicrobium sp.]
AKSRLLGFVHPNARIGLDRLPRHRLEDPYAHEAVVGLYALRSTRGGLKCRATLRPQGWRKPEPGDATVAVGEAPGTPAET